MGFFWSKPTEMSKSLLDTHYEHIFCTADILLVRASPLEEIMNDDSWSHVAIIVSKNNRLMAFSDGHLSPINEWICHHAEVFVRHCKHVRPLGFDGQILKAAKRTSELLLRNEMDIRQREGFCVGSVLVSLGFISSYSLAAMKPDHFSSTSPFNRLQTTKYSNNMVI